MIGLVLSAAALFAAAGAGMNPPTPPAIPVAPPAPIGDPTPAVVASNTFGLELFRTISAAANDTNLFISPYSMSVALTMAAEGARGQTESEMSRVLAFPASTTPDARAISAVHAGHAALARRFVEAAGTPSPNTRERIKELRKQLDEANAKAQMLSRGDNWQESHKWSQSAANLATELNALLTTVDRFDLRVANALWVEQTFSLIPEYTRTIGVFYGTGGVNSLNIARDPEPSRLKINGWVENHTEHRIKDLIPRGTLTADARLVITNAVYFKGEWAAPFTESSTREEDFTLSNGKKVRIRLMQDHWRSAVPYAAFSADGTCFETPRSIPKEESKRPATYPSDNGFSMIELPYKGGELSMVVIAPRTADGLPALERRLTAENLDAWLKRLDRRTVDTSMPRFKMEFAASMNEPLQSMGMRRAFASPGLADGAEFPGMSAGTNPADQLFIGAVLHKAWVEVTEKGTEAAAATAVAMMAGAAARPQEMIPFNPIFRADHPFLFLIRDTTTGVVLFIGRMTNPAA